jgi:hypothetical protein
VLAGFMLTRQGIGSTTGIGGRIIGGRSQEGDNPWWREREGSKPGPIEE